MNLFTVSVPRNINNLLTNLEHWQIKVVLSKSRCVLAKSGALEDQNSARERDKTRRRLDKVFKKHERQGYQNSNRRSVVALVHVVTKKLVTSTVS